MNRIDFKKFANGINFNIKLDASSYDCDDGKSALGSMYKTSNGTVCRCRPICWIRKS